MDFSRPFRVITPTLDGPILSALAGVEGSLTRTQIVALVGDASEAGVRKALARLVEQGIAVEHRIGSRYAYEANRDHLLWPSVAGIFSARRLLRQRLDLEIAQWTVPPISIELFGSVARRESDAMSDIDLMIMRPELGPAALEIWEGQVARLHDEIVRWTGNACDIVVLDPVEFEQAREADEPILRHPTANVVGEPLAKLMTRSSKDLAAVGASLAQASLSEATRRALTDQARAIIPNLDKMSRVLHVLLAQQADRLAASGELEAMLKALNSALDPSGLVAIGRAIEQMTAPLGEFSGKAS